MSKKILSFAVVFLYLESVSLASAKPLKQIVTGGKTISKIVIHPTNPNYVATVSNPPSRITLWDVASGTDTWSFSPTAYVAIFVGFSGDGQWVATAGFHPRRENGGPVPIDVTRIGDIRQTKQIKTPFQGVRCFSFSQDSRHIAVGGGKFVYRDEDPKDHALVYELSTGKLLHKFKSEGSLLSLHFTDNQTHLVAVDNYKTKIWNLNNGRLEKDLKTPFQVMGASAFSPDMRFFAGSTLFNVRIFDTSSGEIIQDFVPGLATDVRFSRDLSKVAAVYGNGMIRIWNVESGKKIFEALGHDGKTIQSLDFSTNDESLFTAGNDGKISIWSLRGI